MIPDQAVEASARWLYAHNKEWGKPSWEDAADDLVWNTLRKDCREEARELLETVAPHMAASVIDELALQSEALGDDGLTSLWIRTRKINSGLGRRAAIPNEVGEAHSIDRRHETTLHEQCKCGRRWMMRPGAFEAHLAEVQEKDN